MLRRQSMASLTGHKDGVTQAVFIRRSQIASSSHDGSVRVWSVAGAAEPRVLKGHDGAVHSVAFSGRPLRRVRRSGRGRAPLDRWRRRPRHTEGARRPGHGHRLFGRWSAARVGFPGQDGSTLGCGDSATGGRTAWTRERRHGAGLQRGWTSFRVRIADNTVKVWDARRVRIAPADPAVVSQVKGVGDLHADSGASWPLRAERRTAVVDLDSPDRFTTLGYTPSGPGPTAVSESRSTAPR